MAIQRLQASTCRVAATVAAAAVGRAAVAWCALPALRQQSQWQFPHGRRLLMRPAGTGGCGTWQGIVAVAQQGHQAGARRYQSCCCCSEACRVLGAAGALLPLAAPSWATVLGHLCVGPTCCSRRQAPDAAAAAAAGLVAGAASGHGCVRREAADNVSLVLLLLLKQG